MMGCRAMALSHRRIAGLGLALLGLVLLAQVFALSHRTALARLEVEAGVSARVRAMAPDLPLLIPGVGAQGRKGGSPAL